MKSTYHGLGADKGDDDVTDDVAVDVSAIGWRSSSLRELWDNLFSLPILSKQATNRHSRITIAYNTASLAYLAI